MPIKMSTGPDPSQSLPRQLKSTVHGSDPNYGTKKNPPRVEVDLLNPLNERVLMQSFAV